jgi:BMFP domain-containing protein YqiC
VDELRESTDRLATRVALLEARSRSTTDDRHRSTP